MAPDTDGFVDTVKALFWSAVFVVLVTLGLWLGMEE